MRSALTLRSCLTVAALAIGGPLQAQTPERLSVTNIKPLLKRAIEHGSARGVLAGEAAAFMRQKFDSSAPIEIDVRALHALAQPGCSRLEVKTRQKDVQEKDQRSDKALTYQVSYCRDGRFPDKR